MSTIGDAILALEAVVLKDWEDRLAMMPDYNRVRAIARNLALADGVGEENLDRVVMGYAGGNSDHLPTLARVGKKGVVALCLPMAPAWVNYVNDAKAAIEVVDKFTAKGKET
jgi:hypothetical protein